MSFDSSAGTVAAADETPADAYERAGYVAALEKAKTTYGSLS